MSALAIEAAALDGVARVLRRPVGDARGAFARLFCAETLQAAGWRKPIAQINLSRTATRGALRGLHFQRPPAAEMKLVSCIHGAIFDVAVDVRVGSATYGRWHGEVLSDANAVSLLIPEGFAHGFQALTDDVEMVYCHSAGYDPSREGGLDALDPALAIAWPEPVGGRSARDQALPSFDQRFQGVVL